MTTMLSCFAVILISITVTAQLMAAEWLQFRGPGGQGTTSEKNLPLSWSDTENVAWKTELPGFGSSSPIALGDSLYVTCYSGYGLDRQDSGDLDDLMLHVVCLSDQGKITWDKQIQPSQPESERVRDHGYAAQTPVTDGEHLYVFFGKTGVFKLDLQGNQLWQAGVGEDTDGWGSGTSPVLYKNLVIVNASVESGSLVAIDKGNGFTSKQFSGVRCCATTRKSVEVDPTSSFLFS